MGDRITPRALRMRRQNRHAGKNGKPNRNRQTRMKGIHSLGASSLDDRCNRFHSSSCFSESYQRSIAEPCDASAHLPPYVPGAETGVGHVGGNPANQVPFRG